MRVTLPKPIGSYTVGIQHISFKYTYEGKKRELPLFIYYPADGSEGKEPFPYGDKKLFPEAPNAEELTSTITQCFKDIKISDKEKSYPLIVFSTGLGCFAMFNTVLCSDLASSGFIVVSIGHTDDEVVYFPDGRMQRIGEDKMQAMGNKNLLKKLEKLVPKFNEYGDSFDAIKLGKKFFGLQEAFNENLVVWNSDKIATIDYMEKLNRSKKDMFSGRINFKLGVSVAGHSYGGAASVDVARMDKRVVCGINLDGGNFGEHYAEDIKKPFLSLGNPNIWGMLMGYVYANTEDSYYVGVLDGDHMGFTDFIYFEPKDRVGTRDTENYRMLITEYCLSFLKTYQTKEQEMFGKLNYKNTKYFEKSKMK